MKKDPKQLAYALMGKGMGKEEEDTEDTEDDGADDKEALATDVLTAIQDKDPEALAGALKEFFHACSPTKSKED